MTPQAPLRRLARFFDVESWAVLVAVSVAIGLLSGAAALLLDTSLQWLSRVASGSALALAPSWQRTALLLGLPALGGLVAGVVAYCFAPEAEGHGTDALIRAFHKLKGYIRPRVPLVKGIASVVTIGTGGSAGKEGPIAQIGAGLASWLCDLLHLDTRRRRIFLLAGASGGVGAIFRAPLGGALFAAEVVYREPEFEYAAIVPGIISSITAYALYTSVRHDPYIFQRVTGLTYSQPRDLVLFAVLGVLCAVGGWLFVKVFYGARDRCFRKLPIPQYLRPAIGGLLVGLLSLWLPEVLGGGYVVIQDLIDDHLRTAPGAATSDFSLAACQLVFVLVLAKIVAVSLTISSGGSGGVFAPSLCIGGLLGGALGYLVQGLAPGLVTPETRQALILVGMAAFFAGVAKVPIAGLIMVTEMTGSYGLVVPLMLTSTITFMLSRRWSIYEEQVPGQMDSPAHLGDFALNVLQDLKVRDVFTEQSRSYRTVAATTRLGDLAPLLRGSLQPQFPVLDAQENLVGVVALPELQPVLNDELLGNLVLAGEICQTDVPRVAIDDNLHRALRQLAAGDRDVIPVIDNLDRQRYLGMISRADIILAYDRRLRSVCEAEGAPPTTDPAVPYRGDSALTEIVVHRGHRRLANRRVRDITFPPQTLLASIQRGNESIIPNGNTEVLPGDQLLILTRRGQEGAIHRALTAN